MTDRQRYVNRIIRQATDNAGAACMLPIVNTHNAVIGASYANPDPQWMSRDCATFIFFEADELIFSATSRTKNDLRLLLASRIPATTLDALARALYRR